MKTKRPWKEYGRYGSVGIELVLSILIGFYGGRWLDGRFGGGHGWLTIAGFVVGAYAGFRQIFRASKEIERAADEEERQEQAAKRIAVASTGDPSKTGDGPARESSDETRERHDGDEDDERKP